MKPASLDCHSTTAKLYAISDLHLSDKKMQAAIASLPNFENDWLIIAGDVGENLEHLQFALNHLFEKFKQIIWVPGNHDLWSSQKNDAELYGEEKYKKMVSICHSYNTITPEDQYVKFASGTNKCFIIVPVFTLYDYSFRPDDIPITQAVDWALEDETLCSDEFFLIPKPYENISDWCKMRIKYTQERLEKIPPEIPIILINHYPTIEKLAVSQIHPRFKIWCGTRNTENWHLKYNIKKVVYGHMHTPSSQFINNTCFEEVSIPYPITNFDNFLLKDCLKQILP